MASPLAKKLGIKPGYRLLILNAPQGYTAALGDLPEGAQLASRADDAPYDFVQAFIYNRADVGLYAPQAVAALKPGGMLWLTYPKKTSKIKTDVSRDEGWDAVQAAGFEGIALISVDDTWSAMRFRPSSDVKSSRRG